MRKINQKLKNEIAGDSFMKKCCITGSYNVSWEHCWIYAGKQVNEKWAIVPLERGLNTSHPPIIIKELCKLISLNRATKEDLAKYPKKNWSQIRKFLNLRYEQGKYKAIISKYSLAREKI